MEEKDEKEENTDKPTPLFKTEKIPRVLVSKEESRRRMRTIGEWREKRLAELRAKLLAESSGRNLLSDPE
jgi:hypothetical protein